MLHLADEIISPQQKEVPTNREVDGVASFTRQEDFPKYQI